MTGIERLREFVAGISPITGVTKTAYDREHMESVGVRLRDFLADIADQIERERDEDAVADRDEVERRLLARLMPEGMSWPAFEDGEPVRIGDEFEGRSGDVKRSFAFLLNKADVSIACDGAAAESYRYGERVRRPAPKDSWERLEEDAKAEPGEYCVTHELSAAYMGGEAEEYAKAEDLVRRAKALAGRDA